MLESAFQQAQYSGFAFHEAAIKRLTGLGATFDDSLEQHNDGGALKAANRYLQSLRSMMGANGRANDREKAHRSAHCPFWLRCRKAWIMILVICRRR